MTCGAKTRRGTPCKRPAGWGTDHIGKGKCKLHGGASSGRPIINGRYSVKHREKLASKMHEFLADPEPGNLMSELALTRALLQDYLDRHEVGEKLPVKAINNIFSMVEQITKIVERITRILNQTALTQAELRYLQAILSDLVIRFIDDPEKRTQFMVELRFAIEGNRHADRGADRSKATGKAEIKRVAEVHR